MSAVTLIGGQRREVRVTLDEARLAAYNMSPLQVAGAVGASNQRTSSGSYASGNRDLILETGEFLKTADDVRNVVDWCLQRPADLPPRRRTGGRRAAKNRRSTSQFASGKSFQPAVTIAVSKRKGTNAIEVADHVLAACRGAEGLADSLRRGGRDHAQLRRDRRREVERAAVPHGDRRRLGQPADRADARLPRVADRLCGHSR